MGLDSWSGIIMILLDLSCPEMSMYFFFWWTTFKVMNELIQYWDLNFFRSLTLKNELGIISSKYDGSSLCIALYVQVGSWSFTFRRANMCYKNWPWQWIPSDIPYGVKFSSSHAIWLYIRLSADWVWIDTLHLFATRTSDAFGIVIHLAELTGFSDITGPSLF